MTKPPRKSGIRKFGLWLPVLVIFGLSFLSLPLMRVAHLSENQHSENTVGSALISLSASMNSALQVDNDSDTRIDPGDRVRYTATITNPTGTGAPNVTFVDTIDSNSTIVNGSVAWSPVAVNDSYNALGNVSITVPAGSGVLANDNLGSPAGTIAVVGNITSTNNGNVVLAADGSFTYNPPAGFEGTDTFTYTLANAVDSNQGTVSITVTGMIWFINSSASACSTNCGRLSNPFNSITAFNAVNNGTTPSLNPEPGDNIFLYSSATNYTGALTLLNNQKLVGGGATATLQSITGVTVPAGSASLPATGGSRPLLTNSGAGNTLTLAQGNLVQGLNLSRTASGNSALAGTNFNSFTFTEASVTGNTSCSSAINLRHTTGTGNLNVSLTRVDANGCDSGIVLQNTTGSFTVAGTGTAGSGGTIQATNGNNVLTDAIGDGVSLTNATNVSLTRMVFTNPGDHAIRTSGINGLSVTFSSVTNAGPAGENDEHCFSLNEVSGTITLDNLSFNGIKENGINIYNSTSLTANATISNSTFQNYLTGTGSHGVSVRQDGNGTLNATVSSSTFTINSSGTSGTEAVSMTTGVVSGTLNGTVQNSTFNAAGGFGSGGVLMANDGTSNCTFRITGNTINDTNFNGIAVGVNGNATMTAVINGNTIKGNPSYNSNSGSNGSGIYVLADANVGSDAPKGNVSIQNNIIRSTADPNRSGFQFEGILVFLRDSTNANARLHSTINNNQVGEAPVGNRIRVRINGASTDQGSGCTRISGNTLFGNATVRGISVLKQPSSGGTFNYERGVSASGSIPQVSTDNNTTYSLAGNTTAGIVSLVNSGTCDAAPTFAPPAQEFGLMPQNGFDNVQNGDESSQAAGAQTTIQTNSEKVETPAVAAPAADTAAPQFVPVFAPTFGNNGLTGKLAPTGGFAGETVNQNVGALAAGETMKIVFSVTVNSPLPTPEIQPSVPAVTQLSTSGTVSATGFDPVSTGSVATTLDTTTTNVTGAATSRFGESVTFTATANGNGALPPAGATVRFYDGTDLLSTTTLNASRQATFQSSSLSVGAHQIRAIYNGAAGSNGSISANFAHTVSKANTTVAVASSNNPTVFGQSTNLTATVSVQSPGSGTATGTVTFTIGGVAQAPVNVDGSGVATLPISTLAVGSYTVSAAYNGDTNFNTSTGNLATNQVVNKAGTDITITGQTPATTVAGEAFAVTWNVAIVSPGAGTPTGNVTVTDGVGSCMAPVAAGSCSLTLFQAGNRNITATYAGDGSFNGDASPSAAHTVNQSGTTITLSVPAVTAPTVTGQALTVNYSVSAAAPGSGTPTGNVTVGDGVNSCTGTVAAGSCSLTLFTAGSRTLTANYAGDANYTGSASNSVSQQVSPANTQVAIASSNNPVNAGTPVTLTVTMSAVAPGSGIPTGTVVFKNYNTPISAALPLDGLGKASVTPTFTTGGNKLITVEYSGDGNYNASNNNAAPFTQVVSGPTAASVSLSGRIIDANGRGVSKAQVTMVNPEGVVVYAVTNPFGYYRFADVQVGLNYTVSVEHKRFQFASQAVTVTEETNELNFTAQP